MYKLFFRSFQAQDLFFYKILFEGTALELFGSIDLHHKGPFIYHIIKKVGEFVQILTSARKRIKAKEYIYTKFRK